MAFLVPTETRRSSRANRAGTLLLATWVSLGGGAASGCDPRSDTQQYSIKVRVVSASGEPVANATLLRNGAAVAQSSSDGLAAFEAVGTEGETVIFRAQCPTGYRSPDRPLAVALRTFAEEVSPEYDVACVRATNVLIVAVAAKGGAELPIRYLDNEIGRTSSHGAGHVRLELPPGQSVELVLDTRQRPELQPQNPVAHFTMGDSSELAVFKQEFTSRRNPTKRRPRHRAGSAARGPVRIK